MELDELQHTAPPQVQAEVDHITAPKAIDDSSDSVNGSQPPEKQEGDMSEAPVEEAKGQSGYILCDMCNVIVEGRMDVHCTQEHREVVSNAPPTPSPAAAVDAALHCETLGRFVLDTVKGADRGRDMFQVIQNAWEQLNRMVTNKEYSPKVYLFGSCVSMGIWDGMGDADFTVFSPSYVTSGDKEPTKSKQKMAVLSFAKWLRNGGFKFDELEVICHARVPLVKRKRDAKRPYELRHLDKPYDIEFRFSDAKGMKIFTGSDKMAAILKKHDAVCQSEEPSKRLITFSFAKGDDALDVFQRKEVPGVTKYWKRNGRLPEIFYVDFDLSSRPFGVRNSWFLRYYLEQDPVFRAGNLFIKAWSKACGINNSRMGYLTSYAMSILWIYYLLRHGVARFVEPSGVPAFPSEDKLHVDYLPLWPSDSGESESSRVQRLGEMVYGFFKFYATEFNWDTDVVTLRKDCSQGENITTREELDWQDSIVDTVMLCDRVFYDVAIEDVYEDNLNLGRHLSNNKTVWFKSKIMEAHQHCQKSNTFVTLLTNWKERAEEMLQVALFRYLSSCPAGSATIGEIRDALTAQDPTLLPAYELHHRISDLWFDEETIASDEASNGHYNRRHAPPSKPHPFSAKALPSGTNPWAALCDAAVVCCDEGDDACSAETAVAGFDARRVYLTSASIFAQKNTDGGATRDALVDAAVKEAQSRYAEMCSYTLSRQEASATGGDGGFLGMDLTSGCDALVQKLLFTVDGCGFATYDERERFLDHVRAVALALSAEGTSRLQDEPAVLELCYTLPLSVNHTDPKLSDIVFFFKKFSNKPLCVRTLMAILRDSRFVATPVDGNGAFVPAMTPVLEKYVGRLGAEEEVHRERRSANIIKKNTDNRNNNAPVVRRRVDSERLGQCTYCKKKNVRVYDTTNPKADPGSYCMVCWDNY